MPTSGLTNAGFFENELLVVRCSTKLVPVATRCEMTPRAENKA
jgi:hypothetical protein